MSDEDLREAITAAHVLAHPELVVTEAEAARRQPSRQWRRGFG
jgi:hypothetical protein